MKYLVDPASGKLFFQVRDKALEKERPFFGEYREKFLSGEYVILEAPEGEREDELKIQGGALVVDQAKKDARLAAEQAKQARKDAIKGVGAANSIAALRAVVKAMAEDLGYEIQ